MHPKDSDVQLFLDQLRQSKFNFPRFESNSRIKTDAIKIRRNRSTAIKSFCYKNKDKHLRRKIFIQKWQWRLNEIRRVLVEHEFLIPRAKRTQNMIDIQNRWPPKLQKGLQVIQKGYKKRLTEEELTNIKNKKKIYDIQRRLTATNTYRLKTATNVAVETLPSVIDNQQQL